MNSIPQREALHTYLAAIAGKEPASSNIEIRWRAAEGFRQEFWPCLATKSTAERIEGLGPEGDVFVGVTARTSKSGKAAAVRHTWLLWTDCDDERAVAALERFDPPPSIIVRSGTGEHRHAYWPLREPLPAEYIARANRRIAHALEADMASTDPARILRPPGTFNHKANPPTPVECVRLEAATFTAREVVGNLGDPPEIVPPRRAAMTTPERDQDDALRTIAASEYVPLLVGRELDRDGKTTCPFHDDRTPSLHAYGTPERGWVCFGCQRGGTIIDFGASLYGIEPRGRGYHEIRRRLASDLLGHVREMAS